MARAVLLARLGDLRFVSGLDYERSTTCLERALRLYEELADAGPGGPDALPPRPEPGHLPSNMDIPRALGHYRAAEAILARGRPECSALGYVVCGQAATACGHAAGRGVAAAEQALAIADRLGNDRLRATAPLPGLHLVSGGRLAEGTACRRLDMAWEAADRAGHADGRLYRDLDRRCLVVRSAGSRRARAWCRAGARHPPAQQAPEPEPHLLETAGRAGALAGDLADARRPGTRPAPGRYAAPFLALCEGRFDEAGALWEATCWSRTARRGNRLRRVDRR